MQSDESGNLLLLIDVCMHSLLYGAPDKRIRHFHLTKLNTDQFNVLWQTNSIQRHPTSFIIIKHHFTWCPIVFNIFNSTMLNLFVRNLQGFFHLLTNGKRHLISGSQIFPAEVN